MTEKRHVFLCHASEDKKDVVRPMVAAFQKSGVTYWYDEAEIRWGDSITEKVNEGLRVSQFVVVVLSEAFVSKNWPKREMNAALNIEASTGEVRVLPLLVGTAEQRKRIRDTYPILNDKTFMTWDQGVSSIVSALEARISGSLIPKTLPGEATEPRPIQVLIPEMRKQYTQRDKDRFLHEGFRIVREYFEAGAEQIHQRYPEVEVECREIHSSKFACGIYRHGELVNRCKIWVGGLTSSDGISYSEGTLMDINDNNSVNDWLVIDDEGGQLGFKAPVKALVFPGNSEFDQILSAQKAAEYLWLRATERLKHA